MPRPCRQIQVRRTILVVVEGDTEFAFCRYLKSLGSRERNLQIHIKNAHGGSPDKIVAMARRLAKQSAYDQVAIVFDQDKALTAQGEKFISSMRATTFRFTPCVEGFFLKLMGRPVEQDTASCKRVFHQHGLDERAKCDRDAYEKLFPLASFEQLSTDLQFADLWKLFTNQAE